MSAKLNVRISEHSGRAFACVPRHAMWELVEYLAAQRAGVHYGYDAEGFTVTFLRLDRSAAQELLDAWAESRMPEPAPAEYQDAARHSDELCYLPG